MNCKRYVPVLILLPIMILMAVIVLPGCGKSSASTNNPPITQPPVTDPVVPDEPLQDNHEATEPGIAQTDKTEVIYTHMTQRCKTCLCFESRIKWVVENYFKEELANGKLTFQIVNAQETQNATLVKKLGVVGSQLFINTIIDGKDHIRNVEDIWYWDCNNNPPGFNEKVQEVIENSLKGIY